jgi:RNA polymerase sigma-70 factor (ECF subfamily)
MPSRQDLVAALERVAKGDRAAFERLYAAPRLKLYGILARIFGTRALGRRALGTCALGRRALADDVLQDVYVRVWHRAGDVEPKCGSPITWLATIAGNLALDKALDGALDKAADGALDEVRRKAAGSLADFPRVFERPSGDDTSADQERNEGLRRRKQCLDAWAPEKREKRERLCLSPRRRPAGDGGEDGAVPELAELKGRA